MHPPVAMVRGVLALTLALAAAGGAEAAERDLAVQPAEWTLTARVGNPYLLSPSMAMDLDGDGLRDLGLHGTAWKSEPRRQGATDALARSALMSSFDVGPMVAADLDGDGSADLVVGLPGSSASTPTGFTEGRVLAFFGPGIKPDPTRLGDDAVADWTLIGALSTTAFLGERLALGDFTGDGSPDLVAGGMGDSFWLAPDQIVGLAGPLRRGVTVDLERDAPTFRLTLGDYSPVGFGMALGDIDGDGVADLAVTSTEGVRVFRGNRLVGDVDWTTPDLEVLFPSGPITDDDRNDIPVLLQDVNGDGKADLIVGLASGAGRAFVVAGRSPLPPTIDLGAGGATAEIRGAACCDHLGSSAAIGDWTGDGILDLALGAPGRAGPSGTRADAGAVVVVDNLPSLAGVIDLSVTPPVLTIDGATPGGHLGQGFHGRGLVMADFNGDGRLDLAAEAPAGRPLDALEPAAGDSVQVILGTPPAVSNILHSVGDPSALTVVASGTSSPWDAAPGVLSDGLLHFYELSEAAGGRTTLFVTPQIGASTVRLSWLDGAGSATPADATRSLVMTTPACAAADGQSVVTLMVTPLDSAGARLGAGLDVRPSNPASWPPAAPDGGFRDLGNGSYRLEVQAGTSGPSVMPVEVDGVVLSTTGNVSFSTSAPSVTLAASPAWPHVGDVVTFSASVTGGTTPYSYTWDLDGDGCPDSVDASPSFRYWRAGSLAVVVDVQDASGCVRRKTLSLPISGP